MTPAGALTAPAMAGAVAADPQFRVPERPRWPDGLVIVPVDDGLLVDGGPSRQLLRGSAARSLVPEARRVLDGRRDLPAIAAELGLGERAAAQLVALLYTSGLLEDGADGEAPDSTARPEVRTYVARLVDSTRVERSGAGVLRRLAAARVHLVDGPGIAASLVDDLRGLGLGGVTCSADAQAVHPEATLAIGLGPGLDAAALDRTCRGLGIAWIPMEIGSATLTMGPRIGPGELCLDCVRAATLGRDAEELATQARAQWSLGIVAAELSNALGRIGQRNGPATLRRIQLDTLTEQRVPVPRRPGCPHCRLDDGAGPRPASLPDRYEQAVAFPSRELLDPKDHQHHYRPANLDKQREAKRYRSGTRVPLPGADQPAQGSVAASGVRRRPAPASLQLQSLADVLLRCAGRRRPNEEPGLKVQRWSPTGGNLGSVNAYLVVEGVDGLRDGAHHYDGASHELVALSARGRPGSLAAVTDLSGGGSGSCVVVLTGALERVASKYGPFGYRIVYLDAGCAITQARWTAAGRGLELRAAVRWEDAAVGELLGLDVLAEPVTAVMSIVAPQEGRGAQTG